VAASPVLFKHVAVMPDCHLGKGATVGTVIATRGGIIPAAVGVDIGCGMIAVRTSLEVDRFEGKLKGIRQGIERRVPLSAGHYNRKIQPSAARRLTELKTAAGPNRLAFYDRIDKGWEYELGSLGSGNHFIEILKEANGHVWVVLHSGSRGIGNKIASRHIDVAKEFMKRLRITLPDADLAYIPENTSQFDEYMADLAWAQRFALVNREEMMDRVLEQLAESLGEALTFEEERIQCHHNFTQRENHFHEDVWVTRKGAIQMRSGQRGIIPGSMATAVYIVTGLGNKMAFESAPHGAGRRFSRGQARRTFTYDQLKEAMAGIEWSEKDAFIDEIPGAYKDIEAVMKDAEELVKVDHRLTQLMNVKGD
jgi:tRNA-splicing ligase RtcB